MSLELDNPFSVKYKRDSRYFRLFVSSLFEFETVQVCVSIGRIQRPDIDGIDAARNKARSRTKREKKLIEIK